MSDALEKVIGIERLPLFPLPLVMLPNELLPLYIFEDRYQQMLKDVAHTGKMFGVMLFEGEESFVEKPEIGAVGCVAEIRESELLQDGRSSITTLGIVRYRLMDYIDSDDPYLVGEVAFFEDDFDDEGDAETIANEVFAIFQRIARAAFKMSGNRGSLPEISRGTPEQLSFLVTAAFNFENELKYELLEMTSTVERLSRLKDLLAKMVGQMEQSADIHHSSKTNGHSKKKLEI